MPQPIRPSRLHRLASALKSLRHKHRLSINKLAQLTGLSRRTLARLESGRYFSPHKLRVTSHESRPPRLSPRTAFKLARFLLGPEETARHLDDATRLSRFLGDDPVYKLLDALYHYPAFLFHDSPVQAALRQEFGDDYRHSLHLLLRSGFGTRNLGRRLRAFRLTHDLTLQETAALLDLSDTHTAALEAGSRRPSPRTRYRILRLLTLPLACHPELVEGSAFLSGHGRRPPASAGGAERRAEGAPLFLGEQRAGSCRTRRLGRVGTRAERLASFKAWLSLPPPDSSTLQPRDSPDLPLRRLRHLWLAGSLKTRDLAARLGIGQPHLIRLLRGDRKPSRALTDRIQHLFL